MSSMYINPALVTMCIAMLMAFFAVGGLLWKLSGRLTTIEVNQANQTKSIENLARQLNNHIADCERSGD